MSLWKRGRQYWTDFTVAGRRYRKRLGTTNLRVATRRERELIEEAGHGRLNDHEQGPHCLSVAIDASKPEMDGTTWFAAAHEHTATAETWFLRIRIICANVN